MDSEAETLSELTFFMLYRSILVSGAGFIKIMDLLTEEGSTFDDFSSETSAEISIFSAQQDVGMLLLPMSVLDVWILMDFD